MSKQDPGSPHEETYGAAFRAGMWLGRSDDHRGANEGLGEREIRALADENARAWGLGFAASAIESRGREAERRRGARRRHAS